MSKTENSYVAPKVTTVGSLHELTLVSPNKYATKTPDGILFHPVSGPPIPLSS